MRREVGVERQRNAARFRCPCGVYARRVDMPLVLAFQIPTRTPPSRVLGQGGRSLRLRGEGGVFPIRRHMHFPLTRSSISTDPLLGLRSSHVVAMSAEAVFGRTPGPSWPHTLELFVSLPQGARSPRDAVGEGGSSFRSYSRTNCNL